MVRIRERLIGPGDPNHDGARWSNAIAAANIPARYAAADRGRCRGDTKAWLDGLVCDPGSWLGTGVGFLILGPYRTGKSCAAGILALEAMRRCEVVLWVPARDVPGVMFRDGDRNAELHDRLQCANLVVLDDLGSESYRMDRPGGAALEGFIRTVYDRQGCLIVTSNLGDVRIREQYPEALVSVLQRTTTVRVIEDVWPLRPGEK